MVATVALKSEISIWFFIQRVLHDRKVCRLPKGNPAPEWTSLARFRSASTVWRQTQSFKQIGAKTLASSSPRPASFVNKDGKYFVNSTGSPAVEPTLSFQKLHEFWTHRVV